MLKFTIAAVLLATAANGALPSTSVQTSPISGAVQVRATESVQSLRTNYNANSRGTIAIVGGEIVVITAGHAIDVSERDSRITRVSIQVNGQTFPATNWESHLGSSQDIGYIHFNENIQNILRPMALSVATSAVGAGETGRLFYVNRGRADTTICNNVTSRRNMVLQARGDGLHPTTRVHVTAECNRAMGENSLSGSSLLNANGEIVAIFFADIEGQRGMNAAFSAI